MQSCGNFFCRITVVGFSIYKSYYISEQKTKYIDVYRIFSNEYTCIKRINENKTLQKCTFFMKVKNYKYENHVLVKIYRSQYVI
jgi:hypothetical protein